MNDQVSSFIGLKQRLEDVQREVFGRVSVDRIYFRWTSWGRKSETKRCVLNSGNLCETKCTNKRVLYRWVDLLFEILLV